MALFEWKDDFNVYIMKIDLQHKSLVDMINKLHDAMISGKSNDVIGPVLNKLVDYAQEHFNTEENYFEIHNYPDTENHVKTHHAFVEKVVDFQQKFKDGKRLLSVDMLVFLKDWLINHINGEDKKYAPFLKSKGIQ